MPVSIAVIGANFGDEGKGLVTDALVRRHNAPLVARFNGGAQAGHTVVSGDKRHVFGHVSAGTLAGAGTYMSSKFIVNPLVLAKELAALTRQGIAHPVLYAHPKARVSTVFDMALNSMAELVRSERHGSCGLGINETVTRDDAGFGLSLYQVKNESIKFLANKLRLIRDNWVPVRAGALGLRGLCFEDVPANVRSALSTFANVLNDGDFIKHATMLQGAVAGIKLTAQAFPDQAIIFEGAQGLALDEHMGEFPHVTRSITGLPWALYAAAELQRSDVTPYYVSRAYLTRHGAGPLEHDSIKFCADPIFDSTNVTNDWQGAIRFAPLNLPMLHKFISADLERAKITAAAVGVQILPARLVLTCLDQVQGLVGLIDLDGTARSIESEIFAQVVSDRLNIELGAVSSGPQARHVRFT